MGARDDLIAIPDEVLRNGGIGQAVLVFMDFLDTPKRWWIGFGDLSLGGHVWQGLGDLISISPISSTYQVSAEQVTFEVAATAEMMALAQAARTRVRHRDVTVYLQLYTMEPEAPIGSPIALFSGQMMRMPWSATGTDDRKLRLECEGNFFRRNQPPRGRWTDADQKARYPGDKGLERLPLYSSSYETKWRG